MSTSGNPGVDNPGMDNPGVENLGPDVPGTTPAPDEDRRPRRRAPGLFVFALALLAVAAWGLAGGPELPDVSIMGWATVGVGVLVGLVLIVAGARSSKD